MSTLEKVLKTLTKSESRLFGEQYSPITDEFYETESDEIDESISGMDGTTQQVFQFRIEAQRVHGRLTNIYKVQARYFKLMKTEAIVPGAQLLDFLLHARIVVLDDGTMRFDYSSALQ